MPLDTSAAPPAPPPPLVGGEVTAGSLLHRSIEVWWRNLLRFGGFTLVLVVPVVAAVAFMAMPVLMISGREGGDSTGTMGASLAALAIAVALVVVVSFVQVGGLTCGSVLYLAGRPVSFWAMLSAGLGRLLPLAGAALLTGLAILGGTLLLVVPGIIVGCGMALAIPALVSERLGPVEAIRRSWALTRGHRGAIFLAGVVLLVMQLGFDLAARFLELLGILGTLASIAVQLLTVSLTTVLPAVAYHDLRALKEGTPTEELARVFE